MENQTDDLNLGKCIWCKGKLVPIGNKRKNGSFYQKDWEGRQYHKKCYREMKERKEALKQLENVKAIMNNKI